jgi:UDP-2-acetamido-3-amino-2,3-dideoxy-glucuronate N-acetyltransferase
MKQDYFSHPSSIIDEGCIIGRGTKIWHFSHLMNGCRIGEDCSIGQNVFIGSNVVLGRNVKVQNNVSLYEGVICEDDVFLGPSSVFTNVINPRSAIVRKNEYRQTLVRKGATIGANATIVCGNEIGTYAFIGAGTVVTKSVLPYALIVGNPGKQKGWMSEQGYPLQFNTEGKAVCKGSGEVYLLQKNNVLKSST